VASACFRASGHREVAGELVDIPRGLPEHPPLLVAFHGLREAATWLAGETQFDALAAKHGFVVAYPNAVRAQKWQLNHRDGDEDIAHIRGFIDAVVKRTCADRSRVYLTGFSNGAGFAYRAGCDLRDQVAAIAPVSGSYRSHDECSAGALPTLEIHGRDPWTDTVARLVADMERRNHCTAAPRTSRIARGITRTRWPGCNLERIYNRTIGHEWPKLGPYNTSAEVWRFVSRFRRN
jgi:polyhydroxybutyrate depolymerase